MSRWRLWGWLLLYVVVLSGTALVGLASRPEPSEPEQAAKLTLTLRHFWIQAHDRQVLAIFEDVVRAYEREHPHVKVNFEGIDQTVHREQKLKSEMVTGTPPDLFVLFGGAEIEPYVRAERLLDLTDWLAETQLAERFRDLGEWSFDDRVYGLPVEGHAEPLYYNRELLRAHGLQPPRTLDELDAVVERLLEDGVAPFALGNQERWPAGIYAHYLMDRYAGPEQILALARGEEGASFANPGYRQALAHLARWAEQGAFAGDPNTLSAEAAVELFTRGEAAMYASGNWDITLFGKDDPDFPEAVGVMPFPSRAAETPGTMAGGYTIGIGLSANLQGAARTAALELMEAFYTEAVQTRIAYEGLRIPALQMPLDARRTDPVFAQVLGLLQERPPDFLAYDNVLAPEVKRDFLREAAELIDGRTDAAGALAEMDASSAAYWEQRLAVPYIE
ncbi:extracellular solute-binding protein [Paenibacillus sp. IB182496]|uniref:Extracellular solute-binding protein n=1 Tax=Paenibacillus sabuli TaxID=2772509 RepID=A0A927GTM5_9BACL|nr:extracellular solute-binding protein [Paenibacillus sabuli]MBD2846887.1 extracellular solute-binding protein [Paenibacillus sabuli]